MSCLDPDTILNLAGIGCIGLFFVLGAAVLLILAWKL
jgi:hypothetical protein